MLTIEDLIENLEKEKEKIEYEYDIEEVCNNYTEEDLYFYESGNRMGSASGVIILFKNNKYKILFIDEGNELLLKRFPIALNMEMELFKRNYDLNYQNEKYEWYETGFGGKLYVDRRILNDFKSIMLPFFDEIGEPVKNNYPNEVVLHAYWITLAKKSLNKK